MRRLAAVIVIVVVAFALRPLGAHHSVTGQFDISKPLTLTGTIARVDWINPHAYVHLTVPSQRGTMNWALSTIPVAMLRKAGITRESLTGKPGERVTVVAFPALTGRPVGWIVRITYADGHYYALFE